MDYWKDIAFWLPALNSLCGAALGASFYILLSAQPYLSTRSFDPKYNSIYIARFITGVIAGVILAIALQPIVGPLLNDSKLPISQGVLAILGGFAAEVVQQILQRLVEVLLTAVRGDASAQTEARAVTAHVQRTAQLQKLLVDYEREVDDDKKESLLNQIHEALARP